MTVLDDLYLVGCFPHMRSAPVFEFPHVSHVQGLSLSLKVRQLGDLDKGPYVKWSSLLS